MSTPRATRAKVAARRTRALDMRARGETWDTIAQTLRYASRGAACTDVKRALDANLGALAESAGQLRALARERLDRLYREALAVLEREHLVTSGGNVVEHEGEPLRDDGPALQAIETLRRLEERRAKLEGLDSPVKTEVEGTVRVEIPGIDLETLR